MNELERLRRIQTLAAAISQLAYNLNLPEILQLASAAVQISSKSEHWLLDNLDNLQQLHARASRILTSPRISVTPIATTSPLSALSEHISAENEHCG